ncbi:MAG: hypothetical protein J1F02_12155 [Lachnospiraceae bacterium]|nr:hypothetical protein [Lachnospiraceae bacterium]
MQWNKPKSVRQIGSIPGHGRIYMEDYVIRFAKKLSEQGKGLEKGAVLLGNTFLYNGDKIYQISGIVEIPNFAGRSGPEFSQAMWNQIYTEIKENFTDLEIIGWYYSCRGFLVKDAEKLLEIHKRNFQHRDKVLYLYEETNHEDSFFLYRNGQFERQKGYYIYYEKNPEMLNYMEKEANRHVHIVEQEDDRVVRNIRGIMEEKEKNRQRSQRRENRLGYGLGIFVALIAVLVGASVLQNQNTMNQVKEQVHNLQELALGEQNNSNTTMVETMGSNLVRVTASPAASSGSAAEPAAATPASASGQGMTPAS